VPSRPNNTTREQLHNNTGKGTMKPADPLIGFDISNNKDRV